MNTPCCSAAAMTSWPLGAVISRPLTVSVTSSSSGIRGLGGAVRQPRHRHGRLHRGTEVRLELVAEATEGRRDRRHRRRSERTDRGLARGPVDARADVVADVEEQVDVLRAAVPVDDALKDLL